MGSFTNGNSRRAELEPLRVLGLSFYHVAFDHHGERHDSLFPGLRQARKAIREWLQPTDYSKQKAWHERNQGKMRAWRREYMRQYRARQNGNGPDNIGAETVTDKGPRDCVNWPAGYGPGCISDRPCSECNNIYRKGPQPYQCNWCGSFTTPSAETYWQHLKSGCPVLHHRPLRRNKLGGLVCPAIPKS